MGPQGGYEALRLQTISARAQFPVSAAPGSVAAYSVQIVMAPWVVPFCGCCSNRGILTGRTSDLYSHWSVTMPKILSFVVLLVLSMLSASLYATTYHVAVDAPGASDSNDGLSIGFNGASNGPWKTLNYAATVARAGDKVLIYTGDYRQERSGFGLGTIAVVNSGTSAASTIEFSAAPGHTPVLDTLLLREKQWIVVSGLTFSNPDFSLPANWQNMPQMVVDTPDQAIDFSQDWSRREAAVRQKFRTYMAIQDHFQTAYSQGIDVKGSSNIRITGNTIERYSFGIQIRDRSSAITVENNDISYCNEGIFTWREQPSIFDSVIRNNRIRQSFNNGIFVREGAYDVVIEDNMVEYSGTSHVTVLGQNRDIIVRNNVGRFGGYYSETMQHPGSSAFNVHTSYGGIILDGNTAAWQVDATGIDGNGFIADLMLDGAGVQFKNNVAYRNVGSGIRTTVSPNSVIVNNTFVENGYQSNNARNGSGVQLSRDQDISNTITNNIFLDNHPAGIKSYFLMDNQTEVNNNLYYSQSDKPFIWDGYNDGERSYDTLNEVLNNTGWEQSGVQGDPLLENTDSLMFRPTSQSPAIDAGQRNESNLSDIAGGSRPQGIAYDIGAHEFSPMDQGADPIDCNLLTNGNFESSTGGWYTNTTLRQQMPGSEGRFGLGFENGSVSARVPAQRGFNYTVTGNYNLPAGSGWSGYGVDYLNAANEEIGEKYTRLLETVGYADFELTGTVPAGTAVIRLWISAPSRYIELDDLVISESRCAS